MRFALICILLLLFVFAWAEKSMEEDFEEEEEGIVCSFRGVRAYFSHPSDCHKNCPGTCS